MSINDFYYDTVIKQHTAELRRKAEQDRLAKIARRARRQERAAQREVRRLQVAVDGPSGLRHALRTLFAPEKSGANDAIAAHQDEERTVQDRTSVGSC
ncbi:MAG: hypothetical protein J2P23_00155 [Microlunatus sp.]|nr:hypothetical protein [Microlunatus sp.]